MQRVRIEPERTGWARISDLLRQNDEMAVQDVKEDIDTLLVFVRRYHEYFHTSYPQHPHTGLVHFRPVSSQLLSLPLSSNRITT